MEMHCEKLDLAGEDLRKYIARVEKEGHLIKVTKEVDPKYEASSLIKRAIEHKKAILFERVGGSDIPLLGNTIGFRGLLAKTFACDMERISFEYAQRTERPLKPVLVADAPVKEVRKSCFDATILPLLTHHVEDVGPYITAGVAMAKDPDTGRRNLSYNRLQLKGPDAFGFGMVLVHHLFSIYKKYCDRGEPMKVAVVVGLHPFELLAAAAHTDGDELEVAGALRGKPLEVVKCETIDLEVPATAEMVIEGEVLPNYTEPEGPFGDWKYYYHEKAERCLFKVKTVTHRRGLVFQTILAGSLEDHLILAIPREADIIKAIRKSGPDVKNVVLTPFCLNCVVQMEKKWEGEPMKAVLAAFAACPWVKICIVVDQDVNPYDMNDVLWAVATRTQLDRDVNIIKNIFGYYRDPHRIYQSKMGIDATVPLDAKQSFRRIKVFQEDIQLDRYM